MKLQICLAVLLMVLSGEVSASSCSVMESLDPSYTWNVCTLDVNAAPARYSLGGRFQKYKFNIKPSRGHDYTEPHVVNLNLLPGPHVTPSNPIFVVVEQQSMVSSLVIPAKRDMLNITDVHQPYFNRSICLQQKRMTPIKPIYVEISTRSSTELMFTISTELVHLSNYTMQLDEPLTLALSATSPKFVLYNFDNDTEAILVLVSTSDATSSSNCMVIGVQDTKCPMYDLQENIERSRFYQTVTTQGAIRLLKKDFRSNAIYIMMELNYENSVCTGVSTSSITETVREKTVTLLVKQALGSYVGPVLFLLGVFLGIALITIGCLCCLEKNWCNQKILNWCAIKQPCYHEKKVQKKEQDKLPSNDNEDKSGRTPLFSFMKQTCVETTEKSVASGRNKYYCWGVLLLAIFYALPVMQLVASHYANLIYTGNQDRCYYNFRCASPWLYFHSFNNVYSNLGYIIVGILCFVILRFRKDWYERRLSMAKRIHLDGVSKQTIESKSEQQNNSEGATSKDTTKNNEPENGTSTVFVQKGVEEHFGIYYGISFAIIVEGVLSACYHVCPSSRNFQFDTSFMYMIGLLFIMQLYQQRHPAAVPSSYKIFAILAVPMIIIVCWLSFKEHVWFLPICCVVFVALTFGICVVIYLDEGFVQIKPKLPAEEDKSSNNTGGTPPDAASDKSSQHTNPILESNRSIEDVDVEAGNLNDKGPEDSTAAQKEPMLASTAGESAEKRAEENDQISKKGCFPKNSSKRCKLGFLTAVVLVGIMGVVIIAMFGGGDLASIFLGIILLNLFIYLLYYLILKWKSNEKVLHLFFFALFLLVVWVPAVYLLLQKLTEWKATPAVSREGNKDCWIFDFYDSHDIWHMLSALALFLTFVFMLIIDDSLHDTESQLISIF